MKKRYFIYIIIVITTFSCAKSTYIPEDVYYSVDFGDNTEGNSHSRPKSDENSKKPAGNQPNTTTIKGNSSKTNIINSVIMYSSSLIGTPYKYGGTTPSGFDCSGFIMYIFKNNNVELPRNTADMVEICDKIDKNSIQPGDLVFFKGSNARSNDIGHVALVTEKTKDGFKMIHASSSKGVIINDFNQYEYWKTRYLFAARIKDEYFK